MATKQPATKTRRQSATGAAKTPTPSSQAAAVKRRQAAPRRQTAAAPVTPEDRYRMIAEAAYHRARMRGFAAGGEVQDWLEAEAEIDARLREA